MNILYTKLTKGRLNNGAIALLFALGLLHPGTISQIMETLFEASSEHNNTKLPTTSLPTSIASDSTDCSVLQASARETDFVPVVKCQFNHPGIITYQPPLFADIDGDGETEIVVALDHSPDGFAVINPNTCTAEHLVDVGEQMWYKDGGLALGDVDHNGRVDVFIAAGTRIQRWEYDPATLKMEKLWQTDNGVATAERAHLDIIDMNQDGQPEIIPNIGRMVNGVTGQVYGGELPALNGQGKGLFAYTADAILEPAPAGQSNVELLFGAAIYRYHFQDQYWVKVSSLPNFEHWGRDANVSIADMDLDGDLDAVVTNYDEGYSGEALIWDLQTETLLGGTTAWDYPNNKGSRMNISNLDDDPYPEMVMTSRFSIFAVDDIVTTGGFGNIIWLDVTSDESGHTQLTSFDFDGDGAYEIAYRDETHLRVFSGLGTMVPTNGYPSSPLVVLNSGGFNSCQSYTGMEYPTIGDIDQDNQAEMIATCNGLISIYESGSLPWRNATRVWNTQAFNVTNVNQDGTIPAVVDENYRIYNNFLAQVTIDAEQDSVYIAVPDAYVTITELSNPCAENIEMQLEICNQGEAPMPEGTPIAIYYQNPTTTEANLLQINQLERNLQIGLCVNQTIYNLPPPAIEGTHYYAVVNDGGQIATPYILDNQDNGGAFPFTGIIECDYTNNMADSLVTLGSEAQSQVDTTICEGETYYIGGTSYTETGVFTQILPSATGCDSMVTLNLEVIPAQWSTHTQRICSGTSFTYFDDQIFSDTGTYYDTLKTVNGCDSIAVLELILLPSLYTTQEAVICPDEIYNFNGTILTETGTYVDSLQSFGGCDSIVTLELRIEEPITTELNAGICESEFYSFNGRELSETGIYTIMLQSFNGCDSLVQLDLTVREPIFVNLEAQICEGETYQFANQSLLQPGTYENTFLSSDGCDSIVTLNLSVLPHLRVEENITICQGESYFLGEQELTQSTYIVNTLTSSTGCDSTVTLSLTVLSPTFTPINETVCEGVEVAFQGQLITEAGQYWDTLQAVRTGCDSVIMLDLRILPNFVDSIKTEICEGESFSIGGETYLESGTYVQERVAGNGCRSTTTIELLVFPKKESTLVETICNGESFRFANQDLTETGTYENHIPTANGCDSMVTLQLFVLPSFETNLNEQLCNGSTFQLGETVYDEAGTFQQIFTAQNGCDSVVNLTLQVLEQYAIQTNASICVGESYTWNGQTYTESGTYRDELVATNGCDSLIALDLEVLPHYEEEIVTTICTGDNYIFGMTTLSTSGVYTQDFLASTGCDSTVTLRLEVLENVETSITEKICEGDSFRWEGNDYSSAGTYSNTLTSANGCDSLVHLTIEILPRIFSNVSAVTCEGHPYSFGTQMLYVPGVYSETFSAASGCDSTVTLHLDLIRNTASFQRGTICSGEVVAFGERELTETGEYIDTLVAANGCDSFTVYQLTVLPSFTEALSAEICEGDSYEFGNQILENGGTYEHILTAQNGCDSTLVLSLEVLGNAANTLQKEVCAGETYILGTEAYTETGIYQQTFSAANGCDSILTLNLQVLDEIVEEQSIGLCEGQEYALGGNIYTETGDYTIVMTAVNGCDSIVNLNLEITPHARQDMSASICEGETFIVGPSEYMETGIYFDTLQSVTGCDSIVRLGLEVLPSPVVSMEASICKGERYRFGNRDLTIAGNYTEVFESASGCDSTLFLKLNVLPNGESAVQTEICFGESYDIGDNAYTAAGTYIDTVSAANGCDSVVYLTLQVRPEIVEEKVATVCSGTAYILGDETYTETGLYTQRFTAMDGCDSIVNLNLTVLESYETELYERICEGETASIGSLIYNTTGVYEVPLRAQNGCDSLVRLNLRVLEKATETQEVTICEGDSYKLDGNVYDEAGTYELIYPLENGCDSILTLHVREQIEVITTLQAGVCEGESYTFRGEELSVAGVYWDTLRSFTGCDSFVMLQLAIDTNSEEMIELNICEGDSILIAGAYRKTENTFEETLQSVNGCDSIVYTTLIVDPLIVIEGYGAEICIGDTVQIGVQGADNYEWFPKQGLSCFDCPEPLAMPTQTTTYTVRSRGCSDNVVETTVTVTVSEAPSIQVTENQEIIVGQSVTLVAYPQANDPFVYWSIDNRIFCSECESITVQPEKTTTYMVTVEDANGCLATDEVTIKVRKECEEEDFFIPNIISPNGDGSNDEFYIKSEIPSTLKFLRIYNRWGETMFETSDFDRRWDGTFRGTPLNPGVYVYYLETICPNGQIFKKTGNITVLK